jgi:hypothetical protein
MSISSLVQPYRKLIVLAAVASAALGLPRQASAEEIPAARRLPKSSLLFVHVPSAPLFSEKWTASLMGRMILGSEMEPFRTDVTKKIEKYLSSQGDGAVDYTADLFRLLQGEIAVALMPGEDGQMAWVVLIDVKDQREALDRVLERIADGQEKSGARRLVEEGPDDTEIIVFDPPAAKPTDKDDDDEVFSAAFAQKFHYFVRDTHWVIGTQMAAISSVAERWSGTADDSLGESDTYQAVMQRLRGEREDAAPVLTWFVDPIAFVQATVGYLVANGNPTAAIVPGFITTLKLNQLKGVGGSYEFDVGNFDLLVTVVSHTDVQTSGLTNFFRLSPASQTPPAWVPATVSGYSAIDWDVQSAFEAVRSSFETFNGRGQFEKLLERIAKNDEAGNLQVKSEIIDVMSGAVRILQNGDDDGTNAQVVIAVGLRDGARFRETMKRMMKLRDAAFTTREFQGDTIYRLAGDNDELLSQLPEWVLRDDQLLVGIGRGLLEDVLRGGDQEPLAQSAEYQKLSAHIPGQTVTLIYTRMEDAYRQLLSQLRSPQVKMLMDRASDSGTLPDMSLLPGFDSIRKYVSPSASYAIVEPNGYRYVSFSLKSAD